MNYAEKTNELLIENGLDFTIIKSPMFAMLDDKQIASDYFGLINSKTNQVIHTVKESYHPSQNSEILEMVLRGIEGFGELSVQKAGSLNGGRKVYIQLLVEGKAKVGNDLIDKYITIIDSNDGSTSLSVGIGDKTMRCQNQFWKFHRSSQMKARHTESIKTKIAELPNLIEIALNNSMRQIELYNKFQSTEISRKLANDMVKYVLGYDKELTSMTELSAKSTRAINKMNDLYEAIETEMNQVGDNMWGLFGGVTRYSTHKLTAPKRENGKIESGLIGGAYNMNQKALEFATKNFVLA
jgi:phage/plasmid-like protein (TIGR03299 family)